MTQLFDQDGNVVPCTIVDVSELKIVGFKTDEKDGYSAYLLGKDNKGKNFNKAEEGKYKEIKFYPRYVAEVKEDKTDLKMGDEVVIENILNEGDKVNVTGITKGKGFAGVMKLHGMRGGPKTHGQSNKPRSIGSIASGQTFAHVAKGRRMARKMGVDKVTVKNLKVVKVDSENKLVCISGALPGNNGSYIIIRKTN